MADKLYLIDGSAFAYRSYFAIRHLTNSKGEPTNAVYGFARVLLKLMREEAPTHMAVVFDAPGKTFRDDLFGQYKATRQQTPEDLIYQMPWMDEVVEAFQIPLLRIEGVEADDVMGTLARCATERGMATVLVTGDKDLLQLVDEGVHVYDPNKGDTGQWYGVSEVTERFGVPPERVIDVLGLMGDTADNVPGVRGIGEKTARKLLETYGSLDSIYEHLDELKGKQRDRLEEDRELALLSRELVTIRTDIPLGFEPESLLRKPFDPSRLTQVFAKLEFHSLLEEFLPDAAELEDLDYRAVTNLEDLDALIAELRAAGEFAIDTETTSVNPMLAELVGISVSIAENSGRYLPLSHCGGQGDLLTEGDQLPREEAIARLRPLLEDPSIGKIGHNVKYDVIVLERAGLPVAGVTFDTMVASYLTDPSRLRHNLEEVSLHYLKRKMIPIAELLGKGSKAVTFDHVPIGRACEYACEDADVTGRLARILRPLLRERGLEPLFQEVELPLIGVLARMEQAGVAIDSALFEELRGEVEKRLTSLTEAIYEAAGEPFQINSPKQLQHILFNKLGLRPIRRTKTGYSTDVEVLEQLALEHPMPERLLEYRMLEKLRSTYIDALPKLTNPTTGRLHTSFNQSVAATGRLSSSNPNLQNIPVRTEMGRRIRKGFVARRDEAGRPWKLVSADYSQIELRVLAHLSEDPALREAFERNADIHTDTAARIFNVNPDNVTPELRRRAKAVNFGVVYGISAFGLARNLGIPNAEAAEFIEHYFNQYPGVRDWIDRTIADARTKGYVTTVLNRRRYVSELGSSNATARKGAERVAINTPVQGSAADIIKLAMLELDAQFESAHARHGGARLLLQVHDELLAEAAEVNAEAVADTMKSTMEQAFALSVPLRVDVGIADSWADAH